MEHQPVPGRHIRRVRPCHARAGPGAGIAARRRIGEGGREWSNRVMTVLLANAPTRIAQGSSRELFYVKAGSRWPFSIEKATAETARYVPFPFSLAYLAALLEKEKLPVEVLDAVALNLPHSEFVARCTKVRPSILVMEATT